MVLEDGWLAVLPILELGQPEGLFIDTANSKSVLG